jgi:hypothetical protein
MRRIKDGTYCCAVCGAPLGVSEYDTVTTIVGQSGKPNVRVLSVDREEIHRCAIGHNERLPRRSLKP